MIAHLIELAVTVIAARLAYVHRRPFRRVANGRRRRDIRRLGAKTTHAARLGARAIWRAR